MKRTVLTALTLVMWFTMMSMVVMSLLAGIGGNRWGWPILAVCCWIVYQGCRTRFLRSNRLAELRRKRGGVSVEKA